MRKRLVYAGMVLMWIVLPTFTAILASLSTDIVHGFCIPWGVNSSHGAEKARVASVFVVTYLLPLMMMIFCYSRIVYALTHKVINHVLIKC